MKSKIILFPLIWFLLGQTSCIMLKHDNGKHKGWYKNPNNPHNPASPKGPGKSGGNPGKGHKK
jgi:hypothetical protein